MAPLPRGGAGPRQREQPQTGVVAVRMPQTHKSRGVFQTLQGRCCMVAVKAESVAPPCGAARITCLAGGSRSTQQAGSRQQARSRQQAAGSRPARGVRERHSRASHTWAQPGGRPPPPPQDFTSTLLTKPSYKELYGVPMILVADDSNVNHMLIRKILEPLGYRLLQVRAPPCGAGQALLSIYIPPTARGAPKRQRAAAAARHAKASAWSARACSLRCKGEHWARPSISGVRKL